MTGRIRVWDGVVRASHWAIATLIPLCWWTAEQGEMEWHQTCAYLLLAVILTRTFWGLVGSDTARLAPLVRSPGSVLGYLRQWRGQRQPSLGHNPAGGYMVLLMLALITAQLVTGLFATDDILTEGPLYGWVSYDTASTLTTLHKRIFDAITIALGLHLLAILVYRLKGIPLVSAMITGRQRLSAPAPTMRPIWPAALVFVTSLGAVTYLLILPLW
ncbi:cytochrome b/b6 domain-containing protein [Ferrimonas marina]|uniref:Cytochrome b n=1 Tax=Ferrimonas marina TaxID=299255 RepID=A0A1M5ZUE2_9GAMM|nr:cytochrome b/b6 domain-containing protein [Ferrimonas marina]SHI27543.1 Cytochrome b [Ferrimonas marina]